MLIRDEHPDDISLISHIHYTAFQGHPAHAPGAEPVEHRIVEQLRASNALTLTLVAEVDGEIAGHSALSPAALGQTRSGWFLFGPIGVLPRFQGRGIGSALVRETLRRMRDQRASGIVLVGDPGFYTRFGFANAAGLVYRGVPDQYVLAACLGDTIAQGEIIPHAAFNVLDE